MKLNILNLVLIILPFAFAGTVFGQQKPYKDGRPMATHRISCIDQGVVMFHGNGPDSCDTYGAREAIINRVGDTYYLFYDGAGKTGWLGCLAESNDLANWNKLGPMLTLGQPGKDDAKSASSPWIIEKDSLWHMFYLGTPNASRPPDRVPNFPYLTMKAVAKSITGPWKKQYDVVPFPKNSQSYYSTTSSPGYIVKQGDEYLQFFSASVQNSSGTKRTLGIAKTSDLNGTWDISKEPIFPLEEQVENSSVYYQDSNKTWYLFTNHIGVDDSGNEYTDAIWVYWSKDLHKWNSEDKAIVLDKNNCKYSKGAIGMPTVIQVGNKLAMLYDAAQGDNIGHMNRDIAIAWVELPIKLLK